MGFYETIFIARQDLAATQVEALISKLSSLVQDQGGEIEKTEYIGLRTLAYLIRKNSKGHYALMSITAEPAAVKELERVMRINEDILRFLTVKVDQHEKGPSALLKASRYQREEYGDNTFASGDRADHTEKRASSSSETPPTETEDSKEEATSTGTSEKGDA